MPYIPTNLRDKVDEAIDSVIHAVQDSIPTGHEDGVLNYAVSRIVSEVLGPVEGEWPYRDIARATAVFECAKLEFYRRVAAPKEDKAIRVNGDIQAYKAATP